jgi:hypothetical protein
MFILMGPGLLAGCTLGDYLRLLRDAGFRFELRRLPNVAASFCNALQTTCCRVVEDRRFEERIRQTEVPPPLFILGHWRSGTTYLHNLFAGDQRFAFPNLYQVLYPHTFLSTEAVASRMMAPFLPKMRVRVDNMKMAWHLPYEDEFALAGACGLSPYLSLVFTSRHEHFDRYLTMQSVSHDEVAVWKETLLYFLRKMTLKCQRPLVLKSPTHTCRIRLLLEMFPDAKFVHIHREPHVVFRSTQKMLRGAHDFWGLQRTINWDDRIVRQYREMYEVFFKEKQLITDGHFCEIAFDDLERAPLETMRRIYESLSLPDFSTFESDLRTYLESVSGYKRNDFSELSVSERQLLADRWRLCFEAWGYDDRTSSPDSLSRF